MGRIDTRELVDKINELSYDSSISLKFEDIKDFYSVQNFIRGNKDCFNKDIGMTFNKEKNEAIIIPHKIRRKKNKPKKIEACIGRLLSEVI